MNEVSEKTVKLWQRTLIVFYLLMLIWLPLPKASNQLWSMSLFVTLVAMLAFLWGVLLFLQLGVAKRSSRAAESSASSMGWWLFGLLMCLQGWVALQWLLGITLDSARTHLYLLLGLAYSLMFIMAWQLFNTAKRITVLLSVLIVSGTFQAFYGSVMVLSGVEWLLGVPKDHYFGSATGTFVNRNSMAGYLELTLACGIGLLMALRDAERFRWRNILEVLLGPKARIRLALIIMVIGLVMTQSRMGNAGFMTALLLVGGVFVLTQKANRLRNSLILVSILLIDLLVISQFFGLERLRDRLINTEVAISQEAGELVFDINDLRGLAFTRMIPLAKEQPLTGYGAGSYEVLFINHTGPNFGGHFDHAHNDYLQFWLEVGLIGLLPLGAFVLIVLWQAFKALLHKESPFQNGLGFGAAMAIIAYLVHSFSDFNLQIPANAATLMVVCAVAVRANSLQRRRSRRVRTSSDRVD